MVNNSGTTVKLPIGIVKSIVIQINERFFKNNLINVNSNYVELKLYDDGTNSIV
jgi:hypothetical protein